MKWRIVTIVILTGVLAAAWLWRPTLPSICSLKLLAGVDCPGCGMTRSVMAAAHGRLGEAVHYHLFGPLVLAALIAAWITAILGLRIPWHSRALSVASAIFLVALLGYWIFRLATGTAP